MTDNPWTRIGMPEPRGVGQRFYTHDSRPGIWIADNSGQTPDDTDDGPLRIREDRPLEISVNRGTLGGYAAVLADSWAGLTLRETVWLIRQRPDMAITVSPEALTLLRDTAALSALVTA